MYQTSFKLSFFKAILILTLCVSYSFSVDKEQLNEREGQFYCPYKDALPRVPTEREEKAKILASLRDQSFVFERQINSPPSLHSVIPIKEEPNENNPILTPQSGIASEQHPIVPQSVYLEESTQLQNPIQIQSPLSQREIVPTFLTLYPHPQVGGWQPFSYSQANNTSTVEPGPGFAGLPQIFTSTNGFTLLPTPLPKVAIPRLPLKISAPIAPAVPTPPDSHRSLPQIAIPRFFSKYSPPPALTAEAIQEKKRRQSRIRAIKYRDRQKALKFARAAAARRGSDAKN